MYLYIPLHGAVNTPPFGRKNQSVNAVEENNPFFKSIIVYVGI
jgi:hypothetical protein